MNFFKNLVSPFKQPRWPWLKVLLLDPLAERKSCLLQIFAALLLLSLAQSFFLLLVGPLFKAIFATGTNGHFTLASLVPAQFSHYIPGYAELSLSRAELAQVLPILIFIAAILKGYAGFVYQYQQQVLALHLGRRYRENLFACLLRLPFAKITERAVGEWMSVVMNDVAWLQSRLSDLFTGLVRDGFMVLASLLALYFIHWPTALILSLLAVPIMLSTGRTGKKISVYAELWQKELARMVGAVLDLRRRFEFIRAQQGEKLEKERFWRLNQGYYRMIRRSILVRSALSPAMELVGFLMFAMILLAASHRVRGFALEPTELLQFFAALGILLRPLKTVGEQLARYHETKGVLRQSLDTFDQVQRLADAESPRLSPVNPWDGRMPLQIARLELAYREGFRLNVNALGLRAGRAIALIGPSGAGKSSFIKVLAGLLRPEQWQANIELDSVVQAATLVSQKPFLFSASIRDNLCYGLRKACSDERLAAELDFVGLSSEFEKMDQTLDSFVDFIHTPLSGGQMQRLTIARALLRDSPLLLMDEVTAAIDPLAEEAITRRLIERSHQEKICLLFATHRLQQLGNFDEIWFVEGGKLQVFASYAELLTDPRVSAFMRDQMSHQD